MRENTYQYSGTVSRGGAQFRKQIEIILIRHSEKIYLKKLEISTTNSLGWIDVDRGEDQVQTNLHPLYFKNSRHFLPRL